MKRFLLLFPLSLAAAPASAVFLDCLFFDTFSGELASVPANWKPLVAHHNCARKSVVPAASPGLGLLSWNASAATTAQNWANTCTWAHNPGTAFGENLYAGAVSSGFPSNVELAASIDWASEQSLYNYAANTCSGACGHYTQMVWRTTTTVGCGFRNCTTGSPFTGFPNWTVVVCNYNPAGNNGQRPY